MFRETCSKGHILKHASVSEPSQSPPDRSLLWPAGATQNCEALTSKNRLLGSASVASSTSSFSEGASKHELIPKRPTMCCWQDTPGAKEMPSEQHKARHAETTNPCRLDVFLVFGLATIQSAISLSSSGHKLEQNFVRVSASRLSPACNEQVACPNSRRNRPRSGLRIFGVPRHTSHPTLETARPPLQAKPAPSALLA